MGNFTPYSPRTLTGPLTRLGCQSAHKTRQLDAGPMTEISDREIQATAVLVFKQHGRSSSCYARG